MKGALTRMVSASGVEDEGRVALPPIVADPRVPVDDKGRDIHPFESRRYLKTRLSGPNYTAVVEWPISTRW